MNEREYKLVDSCYNIFIDPCFNGVLDGLDKKRAIKEAVEDDLFENIPEEDKKHCRHLIEKAYDLATSPKLQHYVSDGRRFLQLSDNHTLWECDTTGDEDLTIYNSFVDDYCSQFEQRTGVVVALCGRSSRHVCVADNFENAENYDDLCRLQQQLEDRMIEEYNKRN